MRIAVISDTHDRLPEHVLEAIRNADEIWHLGDVTGESILARLRQLGPPLTFVRGNCDPSPDWPLTVDREIHGLKIRLIHIPPRTPSDHDLILHGHTHVPRDEVIDKTRFLNPGCITRPNRGAPASYAWLEIEKGKSPGWRVVRV